MNELIIFNDNFILDSDFPNPINRAFKYGDGLFESLRSINGKMPFIGDHISRMINGMKALSISVPGHFNKDYFQDKIKELASAKSIGNNFRVRISVFRDSDGLYTPVENKASHIIEAVPLKDSIFLLNENGYRIDIFDEIRKMHSAISSCKTLNCLPGVMAGIYRNRHNLDECVFLNEKDEVVESISSNIFLLKDNKVVTPQLTSGCVEGIMRKQLIKNAKFFGIDLTEKVILPADLLLADEIFLTNAVSGISWVKEFKGKTFSNLFSMQLVEKLNKTV